MEYFAFVLTEIKSNVHKFSSNCYSPLWFTLNDNARTDLLERHTLLPDFSKYGITSQANADASCNGIMACAASLLTLALKSIKKPNYSKSKAELSGT